jgi:superfamily I DNA/RNA helicase
MKERIAKLLPTVPGGEARNLWMGTFHSVFARILRAEADKLGYPKDFTIYDTDDSRSLIRTIVKECSWTTSSTSRTRCTGASASQEQPDRSEGYLATPS